MRYLVYAARDRHGPFYFVKREDEVPPQWPGLRLEIAGVYAEKNSAELALLEAIRWSAKAEEHMRRCRSAHPPHGHPDARPSRSAGACARKPAG